MIFINLAVKYDFNNGYKCRLGGITHGCKWKKKSEFQYWDQPPPKVKRCENTCGCGDCRLDKIQLHKLMIKAMLLRRGLILNCRLASVWRLATSIGKGRDTRLRRGFNGYRRLVKRAAARASFLNCGQGCKHTISLFLFLFYSFIKKV